VSKDWGAASGSLPGPGNGVQTTTGRLLVAAHHSAYVHDFIVWSDDEGCEKRHLFFEFSLCLSRACLGKMIAVIYKWLKNAVFCSESWTAIKQTFPKMDEVRNKKTPFRLLCALS
jgi:hypothetical protein